MVNKEERYKAKTRASGVILGAGIVHGIFAALIGVNAALGSDALSFAVFGFGHLALAVLFLLLKHPAWGIAATVVYVVGRLLATIPLLRAYFMLRSPVILMGSILGGGICLALTAFFIYADYQAVVLRRLEREREA